MNTEEKVENKSFWKLMIILVILAAIFIAIGALLTPAHAILREDGRITKTYYELVKSTPEKVSSNSDHKPESEKMAAKINQLEEDVIALKVRFWLGIPLGAVAVIFPYSVYRLFTRKKNESESKPVPQCKWGAPLCVLRGIDHEHDECRIQKDGHCMWETKNCKYSHSNHSQQECKLLKFS